MKKGIAPSWQSIQLAEQVPWRSKNIMITPMHFCKGTGSQHPASKAFICPRNHQASCSDSITKKPWSLLAVFYIWLETQHNSYIIDFPLTLIVTEEPFSFKTTNWTHPTFASPQNATVAIGMVYFRSGHLARELRPWKYQSFELCPAQNTKTHQRDLLTAARY